MYIYILCLCGNVLGDKVDCFNQMRLDLIAEQFPHITESTMQRVLTLVRVDLSDIFRALHIERECCKARLTSQVTLKEE